MEPIIEIKNVGKRYNITGKRGGYVALRDIITENLMHPIQTVVNTVKRMLGKMGIETFWALKDVSMTVERGEAVGIIGANGAGKSTLLKILTRITPPTEGEVILRGKVASLLEVGTGFHPELSGRENIFLNGAILGMTRKEIAKKFDDIVAFAGIGDFIDTPVKRYSSGMYVRLAFSIAAHIEPDILLVDEVLAVGDAEFQKKCLGKMEEVTGEAGRTILFVSHNMSAVEKLCKKAVLFHKGKIVMAGDSKKVIEYYLKNEYEKSAGQSDFPLTIKDITLRDFSVHQSGIKTEVLDPDKPFEVSIEFETLADLTALRLGIYLRNGLGDILFRSLHSDWHPELETVKKGHYKAKLIIPEKMLMKGNYFLSMHLGRYGIFNYLDKRTIQKTLTVGPSAYWNQAHPTEKPESSLTLKDSWNIEHITTHEKK